MNDISEIKVNAALGSWRQTAPYRNTANFRRAYKTGCILWNICVTDPLHLLVWKRSCLDLTFRFVPWLNISRHCFRRWLGAEQLGKPSRWLSWRWYFIRVRGHSSCHPDDIRSHSKGIRMTYSSILCYPDDVAEVGISSGWVTYGEFIIYVTRMR